MEDHLFHELISTKTRMAAAAHLAPADVNKLAHNESTRRAAAAHLAPADVDRVPAAVADTFRAGLFQVARHLEAQVLPEAEHRVGGARARALRDLERRRLRLADDGAANPRSAVPHLPRGVLLVLHTATLFGADGWRL